MDNEAGLVGKFADDLDADRGRFGDAWAVVGAVGIGEFDERVSCARRLEQRHGTIAVLNVGGMDDEFEGSPIGIDMA